MYLLGMRDALGLKLIFVAQLMIAISFTILWITYGFWIFLSVSALLIYFGLWVARFHRKHEQEIEYSGSSSRLNAFPKPRKFAVALSVFEGVVMVVFGLFSFLMIFGHQTNLYDEVRWFQAFPFFLVRADGYV
ncbi:hypothetical protein J7399_05330 [Shimia sp. R9_1]|uniref:hypothetical protein n=1 Tax=Shimia sp. R9_1 TaxID=2821111 RepID=UPI001ADB9A79|nr:hypothetical protein [Shimia sp. R9_1]MBO9406838.1 hypothetical protein [Shimia sp. R9_1]